MVIKRKIDGATESLLGRVRRLRLARRSVGDFGAFLRKSGLQLTYIVILVVFSSGTVNAVLEGSRQNPAGLPIIPSRLVQTIAESMLNFSTIATATIGFYLIFVGGRQALRGRISTAFVLSGFLLVSIGLLLGFFLLALKGF